VELDAEPELVEEPLVAVPEEEDEPPFKQDLFGESAIMKGAVVLVRPVLSRIWATALNVEGWLTIQVNFISWLSVRSASTEPPERLSPSRMSRKYGGTPPTQSRRVG